MITLMEKIYSVFDHKMLLRVLQIISLTFSVYFCYFLVSLSVSQNFKPMKTTFVVPQIRSNPKLSQKWTFFFEKVLFVGRCNLKY